MPGRFSNIRRKPHKKSKIGKAADVIARMQAFNALLRVQFRFGRTVYWLEPSGIEIEAAAATEVIRSNKVVSVGTSLFPDLPLPAQTYRFAD
jgi:hypothetical protein